MAARQHIMKSIVDVLDRDLRRAYPSGATPSLDGGDPLVAAFGQFGQEAATSGITIEDTIASGLEVLQSLFERSGGSGNDSATMRAAGIAIAAAVRAHDRVLTDASADVAESLPPGPRQLARLAALHQINRAATANLELAHMLDTVVDVVADTTGSDACEVFLHDDTTGLLILRAAVGLNPASVNAVTIRIGTGITGLAAQESRLISAPDAHRHDAFLAHPGIGDEVYTSQVSVPILLQSPRRLVGVLNIHSVRRREYDQDELDFLQTVSGELAISIENARQYSSTDERLRQKVAQLGTLQRVSRMLASTLDLQDVLRLISEQAIELLHAEAAAIFRLNRLRRSRYETSSPIIEHRVGPIRDIINADERDGLVTAVIRTGTTLSRTVHFVDGEANLFCLPLRTARETVGALCFRLAADASPDDDTLGILQAFSDSAAMAIENAQLYQNAVQSVQTQSTLVQEMHHRVRNNLQTVAALLSLQLRTSSDAPWATEIREAISRIQSIAAVHDLLSDELRLGGTTVDEIARLVAEDAHSTLIPPGLRVNFAIEKSTLRIPTRQATIISLLINELTANAISHGFQDKSTGNIRIRGWEDGHWANIEVSNDGHGVPEGFDPSRSTGLGMRITQRLVTSDLKGSFAIRSDDAGTVALIRFPIAPDLD